MTAQPLGGHPVPAAALAVARLTRQKRLDVLIEATRGWADQPGAPLVVVAGDGPQRETLDAAARAARSPLRLLGRRDDVADLLAAADVVVLPREWEARPLIAQKALRAGMPLVATAVGGVPGLVGDAAVLVPPGDPPALRDRLRARPDDPDERDRLRDSGPRQAATWPTVDQMVDLLMSAYRACRDSATAEVSVFDRRPPRRRRRGVG